MPLLLMPYRPPQVGALAVSTPTPLPALAFLVLLAPFRWLVPLRARHAQREVTTHSPARALAPPPQQGIPPLVEKPSPPSAQLARLPVVMAQ